MEPVRAPAIGFNPTLVRLRPVPPWVKRWITSRFNPTLVRLRQPPPPRPRGRAERFQSHAGSIEAVPS